ncbi:Coenzyme F420 hydrogenase/dehydrogenase, beta subunit C-terminal domain [Desulfobacterium sp. N47]|uniref:Coenzyme F420 hydrogenase/dehydrogenase, beta subunit C-terminal domain n=1 Tax=Desulfobacterium sp. N47 TaxID=3115210 RepID=UPI003C86B868
MAVTAKIDVKNQDISESIRKLLEDILKAEIIRAILVSQHLPMKKMVMPTLVTDPDHLDGIDPLAPAFPVNAATIAARLTRKPIGGKIAAVLRPCEIRAFIELVKLNQAKREDIILISADCFGAFQNKDYLKFAGQNPKEATLRFYKKIMDGNAVEVEGVELAQACKACEYPVSENADIQIGLYGMKTDESILVKAQTEAGDHILKQINLGATNEPAARQTAINSLITKRTNFRDEMFLKTTEATNNLEKISSFFASCVNCYNCRVACPVCYCKECVFVTDAFNHDSFQYISWAKKKGIIKMPTDTLFYHLTRLTHMSTACVGCGQCSNACPNDIPIMELFRTIAHATQKTFDYQAGKSIEQKPPLSTFCKDEFQEVVGIND